MVTAKCKMCGGNLNLAEGITVVECEYCGTKQTVPTADDEKKMTLFARANKLRFSCEFDKASAVYESIIADFPEEAEAYWGLVLCKYGIEYVDDPKTSKKIPTCHRSSFESVMDDEDFEQVMENSDPIARAVYRSEAKQIEELRKSIIEVSGKEESYDIFICYKETDENGERTIDSLIAQDVYDALVQKGYRVFFSRITLEDKLGQEYEPYIFAALNSAKIMLAFGTDYEYYNAVWVKNEWSRFLQLIEKGEKKTLIPCYKGIDAYDIPKEFAKLQAQDMGKVGALQDLMRGIEKLLPKNGETINENPVVRAVPQMVTVEPLLERVFMFLEDEEWERAVEYCERVLDIEPQNPEAYVGLLMADLKIKHEEELAVSEKDFLENKNYVKALKFATHKRKEMLQWYHSDMIVYLEERQREEERIAKKQREEARIAEEKRKEEEYIAEKIKEEKRTAYEKRRYELKNIFEKAMKYICTDGQTTVALKLDGTVVATGWNVYGKCNVSAWENIVAVYFTEYCTIGLKSNGTVVSTGENKKKLMDKIAVKNSIYKISSWSNIVTIANNKWHIVGLKSDGTVVALGRNLFGECEVSGWRDIIAVECGQDWTVGLKSDGTVVVTGNNYSVHGEASAWTDIVSIACSDNCTAGLKSNGTVVTTGDNIGEQSDVSKWKDIVAISSCIDKIVGLKSDGTIVISDENIDAKREISELRDVVAIYSSNGYTVGIKFDGTVFTILYQSDEWRICSLGRDIVAVSCSVNRLVGLKSDGTVVDNIYECIESEEDYQYDVSDWKLFDNLEYINKEER